MAAQAPAPRLGDGTGSLDRAALPVLALAEQAADLEETADLGALQREARARLDRFADALVAAGQPRPAVGPARLALALVLDRAARANPALLQSRWAAGAHRLLFEGEEMSVARLRDFAARAEAAGPAYAEAARFLASCLAHLEASRGRGRQPDGDGWRASLTSGLIGFCLLVTGWALHGEWSFHREALRAFDAEILVLGLDRRGAISDLPVRLDRMAKAADEAERLVALAPVRIFARRLGFDAVEAARAEQREAVDRLTPPVLAEAVGRSLASEGGNVELYDTLRAWDILSGRAEWSPGFLAGWAGARARILPDLQGLGPHLLHLAPPSGPLPQPDPELLEQAQDFARQATEDERAWIELIRSPAMTTLPPWRPAEAMPDLPAVAQRRSGLPIGTPISGAFTAQGWEVARNGGAARAVQTAREEALRMFGASLPRQDDAADRVLARLQRETLEVWDAFLADLRVRPLGHGAQALRVTGLLARSPSPLDKLIRAAWAESGGADRGRPLELQLRVANRFGPAIQYAEGGGLRDISDLFAALNATLGARGMSEELRTERLMNVQQQLQAVTALRIAPPVVVRMVEDVLAQTAVGRTAEERVEVITNPLTAQWQGEVFELCRRVTEGRFPFDPAGPDADPQEFAELLAPGGAIDRFFRTQAEPRIDSTASPWRWKPDARFEGFTPESAIFFQRARSISEGFFGPSGALGAEVRLAALAERGRAEVALGGASAPVRATGDEAVLHWPGPTPAAGIAVSFGPGEGARLEQPGPWGFLRLFGGLRLRERDEGRRFRVDLRAEAGRLFLDVIFPSSGNPLSRLDEAKGFSCPAAL